MIQVIMSSIISIGWPLSEAAGKVLIVAEVTLQQQAYELIKDRIVNCRYLPGAFLNTLELQDNLGISRTPIREAIGRLEQENLVRVIPKKGIIVCDLSINMINTIYETRMLIEPHIVVNYGARVDRSELIRMRELFDVNPFESGLAKDDFFAYDGELHSLIRSTCPNIFLNQALDQIHSQDKRVRVLSGTLGYRLDDSCREHVAIIDAILEGALPKAGELMLAHLKASRETAFLLPVKPE
ncbi:GntR family transcriptional regulator [Deltaproteobacteria bacterium Smac51]|nr:GntR family transcriptional regulator [Deltaproteobacteria bacterium Smac51]